MKIPVPDWLKIAGISIALAAPLAVQIARGETCHLWAPSHGPMPFGVGVYVGLHAIIAGCYAAIPAFLWMSTRRVDGYETPAWLTLPIRTGAVFVLACGSEHLLRAIMRPVVFCVEDIYLLAVTAVASLVATWLISYTSQGIVAVAAFFAADPRLRPVLEAQTPWQAVRALGEIQKEGPDA